MTTPLSAPDQAVQDAAIKFARANKRSIIDRLADPAEHPPELEPVAVFMAGSPGAGKTEASIELLAEFADSNVVRIDPDELRGEFPGYTGDNSWLFQPAVSILVDHLLDRVFKQKNSFLLDGTLSNLAVARRNIQRSLRHNRFVQILYVYQQPMQAWEFVKAREISEVRRIRGSDFVDQYFAARNVVNALKAEFGRKIKVDLLLKNMDNSDRKYHAGVQNIDHHIPEQFTRRYVESWVAMST